MRLELGPSMNMKFKIEFNRKILQGKAVRPLAVVRINHDMKFAANKIKRFMLCLLTILAYSHNYIDSHNRFKDSCVYFTLFLL